MVRVPSASDLQAALSAAAAAHHDYEKTALNGVRDQQWPGFYAGYALGRLGDFASPSAVSQWLEQAPTASDWAAGAAAHVVAQRSE